MLNKVYVCAALVIVFALAGTALAFSWSNSTAHAAKVCCPDGSCCPDGPCCDVNGTAKASCCPDGVCCPDGPCCDVAKAQVSCCPDGPCCQDGTCCIDVSKR